MTITSGPTRVAPSRTLVRGILLGSVCGLAGGSLAVVVGGVMSAFSSGLYVVFFAALLTIPAAFVGAVVGAGAGLAGAAVAVVVLMAATRLPRLTARGRKTAASCGAALGSAGAIATAAVLYAPVPGLELVLLWIVTPIAGGVAARIAWRNIDALVRDPAVPVRERWAWRVLLLGFVVGIAALILSIVLLADPFWWSWDGPPRGPELTAALVALVVVAPTAAVLLSVGAWLGARKNAEPPVEAALVLVAVLFILTVFGASGLSPTRDRADSPPTPSHYPASPADPIPSETPLPALVEPPPPEEASTLFTAADITAASQAQVDGTIAAVGPIDDPVIPAGTTSFPVSIGGCGNLAGGAVMFEVWFLVDDLRGGFARARDAWLAQGFVSDQATTEAGDVEVVGTPDSPIRRMTLENKEGTVKFTVQSVCVAGQDY
ncbi:hypothetical protein GCM10027413_04420 [Conyzicola nivalis]|uniref:Uncharacterized protein n=1 Tax=Conyzicola nivalis TaxID=1477021 RepID=A0A916WJI2_9MICO|nr:hypothetical protein [Conyzicola nivalis]GGB07252.1 hypothetical protein GCM10010979_22210 [Conyzicola nivalis]